MGNSQLPNTPASISTPEKLSSVPSFTNSEFKATSMPVAPKKCRTRGGHSFLSNRFYSPPQPRQLLSQPQLQSSSNRQSSCTPSKQPKPCPSDNCEIDFSSAPVNDSIFLQDVLDTVPSTIPPFPMTRPSSPNKIKINNNQCNNLCNNKINNVNISADISSTTSHTYIPHILIADDIDNFTWNDDSRDYREFLFAGSSGVKINPVDHTCPLSILKTFLTDDLISNIVVFTNTYATICKSYPSFIEKVGGCNRTLLDLWRDVTKC